MLCLHCCSRAFSSCGEQGLLFVAVRKLLFSLRWLLLLRSTGFRRAGFSSCGTRALERRLSSCGARAWLLRGMWDLPRPGLEPVSPSLAGGFPITVLPGIPNHSTPHLFFNWKSVPFNPLHLFHPTPYLPALWQLLVCCLYLWVCFSFVLFVHLFCFLDSTYKWNQMVFVFLCLTCFT